MKEGAGIPQSVTSNMPFKKEILERSSTEVDADELISPKDSQSSDKII
jgi:hypothetical protein